MDQMTRWAESGWGVESAPNSVWYIWCLALVEVLDEKTIQSVMEVHKFQTICYVCGFETKDKFMSICVNLSSQRKGYFFLFGN